MPEIQKELQDIEVISGIGPVYGAHFREFGYEYTCDLLRRTPESVSKELESVEGLTEENIQNDYVPQARLLELPHVTPSIASHLAENKYVTYNNIAWIDLEILRNTLLEIDSSFSAGALQELREDALRRAQTGRLNLQILNSSGDPVSGAEVYISAPFPSGLVHAPYWLSDSRGYAYIEYLELKPVICTVIAEGYQSLKTEYVVEADQALTNAIFLEDGESSFVLFDEFLEGSASYFHEMPVLRKSLDIESLPKNAVLEYFSVGQSVCAQRRHVKGFVEVYTVRLDGETLPGVEYGAYITRNDQLEWIETDDSAFRSWEGA